MSRSAIHFTIPFKAVVKKNNRHIGFNRRTGKPFPLKSPRLKQYEQDVVQLLTNQIKRLDRPLPLFKGHVKALYLFFYKHKARGDWDNLPAALQDCAQQVGVFENDKQIKSASVRVIENTGEEDRTQVFYEEIVSDAVER